jgi:hypothetical protein
LGLCAHATKAKTTARTNVFRSIIGEIISDVLYVVSRGGKTGFTGAVRTAEQLASALCSMTDDLASAMLTDGSEFVDRAFKAVKYVPVTGRDHLETQLVIVAADFADCHGNKTVPTSILHALTVTSTS